MTIDSDRLRVYTVWEPILRTDNAASAAKSHALLDDPRVIQYWTDTRDLGVAFQNPIGLESEPAWDVYLVYGRGIVWEDEAPVPADFMHQLGGRLPAEKRLDAARLAELLNAELEAAAP